MRNDYQGLKPKQLLKIHRGGSVTLKDILEEAVKILEKQTKITDEIEVRVRDGGVVK